MHGSKIQTFESKKKIYIKNSKLILIFIFTYPVNLGIKICSLGCCSCGSQRCTQRALGPLLFIKATKTLSFAPSPFLPSPLPPSFLYLLFSLRQRDPVNPLIK